MKVEAVALADFIHGDINATEGRVCRHRSGELLDSGLAGDLERANLVRIRMAPATPRPVADVKPRDDGPGRPSSVSPPAPASQEPTSSSSKPGGGKTRRSGA